MEILYFEKLRWREIPEQDNPTYSYRNDRQRGRIRQQECLIVCKVADIKNSGVGDGYSVIFVPIDGDIIRKGIFWKFEYAKLFAEALAKEKFE